MLSFVFSLVILISTSLPLLATESVTQNDWDISSIREDLYIRRNSEMQ